MIPVIICGGVGTKMWPVSRRSSPKHFLPLIGGKSLFRKNYEALRLRFEPEEIFVQTNAEQEEIAKRQAPEIPESNYFIEPAIRNTGPAVGFMAAKLFKIAPDEPFMVIQSDVMRDPTSKFLAMIEACDALVRSKGKLITGGFKPEYAVMGVDYLIRKKGRRAERGVEIHEMAKWLDRDTKEKVSKYVNDERAFLHANHYSWTPRLMLDAYRRYRPDWYVGLQRIIDALDTRREGAVVKKQYTRMAEGPTEEVTKHELKNGYVVELGFQWIDFGTWETVDRYLKEKKALPAKQQIAIDSRDNYISLPAQKLVATIGVKGLIIIDTGDALLIARKEQSGKVGEVVRHLKKKRLTKLL